MEHLPFGEVCNRKTKSAMRQITRAISIAERLPNCCVIAGCSDCAGRPHAEVATIGNHPLLLGECRRPERRSQVERIIGQNRVDAHLGGLAPVLGH